MSENEIFKINGTIIDNKSCECSEGLYVEFLITAKNRYDPEKHGNRINMDPLSSAAFRSTATPAIVVGWPESGIVGWTDDTPDGRDGVIIQMWTACPEGVPIENVIAKFYEKFSIKIRQDILSVPTTRLYNRVKKEDALGYIDAESRVGRCGLGFETMFTDEGIEGPTDTINIPLMMPDFRIDRYLGYSKGILGANFWIMAENEDAGLDAGYAAVEAIEAVDGAITSFNVCPSGSMPGNYEPIGPGTNLSYCPTLRNIYSDSLVEDGIESIPEIVIDARDLKSAKEAKKNPSSCIFPFAEETKSPLMPTVNI